jgi:hypothetical protein
MQNTLDLIEDLEYDNHNFGNTKLWNDHDHAQSQADSEVPELAHEEIANICEVQNAQLRSLPFFSLISTHRTYTGLIQGTKS